MVGHDTLQLLSSVLMQDFRHSAGTYDQETDTGDSNGAGMRYETERGDPANAGLQHARVFLEPVSNVVASSVFCPPTTAADQSEIPMDHIRGPLDPGRCCRYQGNGWARH